MALSFSIENILRRTPPKRKLETMMWPEACVEGRFTSVDRLSSVTSRTTETAEWTLSPPPQKRLAVELEGVVAELEDGASGLTSPKATSTPSPQSPPLPSPSSSRSSTPTSQRDSSSPSLLSADDEVEGDEEEETAATSEPRRQKKARTSFTQSQVNRLEARYRSQRYLGSEERKLIAEELGLKNLQVKTWFQNRRMKEKRQIRDTERRDTFPANHLPMPAHLQPIIAPGPLAIAIQGAPHGHSYDLPNHERRFIDTTQLPPNHVHRYGYPANQQMGPVSGFSLASHAHGLLTIGQPSISHLPTAFSHRSFLTPMMSTPAYPSMAVV